MSSPAATLELPKQYDHAAAQACWYPFWLRQGYFHGEPDQARRPFSMVIPPPNVTGALHLGHALNNTLQDILIRWRRMQGYNTLWMPGTDHAGIATQAVVERRIFEEEKKTRHEVAEGDGPVNALDAAMRKALNGCFPNLAKLHLVDYKVRVINSEAGTAAGVRVVIESRDDDEVWGTVGVSENIIEASWIALVDSFEYKLYKDEGKKSSTSKATVATAAR